MNYIIVGLGNPGKQYVHTRHNTGWMALEHISNKLKIKIKKLRFKSLSGECIIGNNKLLFLYPQTYMNNSGIAVYEASQFYKIPPENIIVICDDISLPCGKIRIKESGSAGGHNGLKSIINMLGTENFIRIRIGVCDRKDKNTDLSEWVLGEFSKSELNMVENRFNDILDSVMYIIDNKTDIAMTKFN